MARCQRLDAELFVSSSGHLSYAGPLTVAAHRVAQTIIDWLRVQQCVNEGLAVADGESELVVFLDSAAGRVLHAGQHEVCHGPPLEGGGTLD